MGRHRFGPSQDMQPWTLLFNAQEENHGAIRTIEPDAALAAAAAAATASLPRPSLLNRLITLDSALSLRIHSLCRTVPRSLLKALEISGDGRFWFPIPLSLLSFSSSAAAFPLLLALLLGSLLDLLLVGLVKHLVRRPRPVYNKGMSLAFAVDHWSFPSRHSSRVLFIASFLRLSHASLRQLLAAPRWIGAHYGGDPAELLLRLVLVWSVATSASRVLLGRHFVLDVVAGSCLGVLEAFIGFHLFHSYRF